MSKPTTLPSWATTLANDPVTGQPNRAEPSAGKKITGFNFNEKPPRQDVNWLHWLTNQWLDYFNSVISKLDTPVFMVPGKYTLNYTYSTKKLNTKFEGDNVGVTLHVEDNSVQDVSSPGHYLMRTILRQSFIKPFEFNKLNLSFLAKSSINFNQVNGSGVRTQVFSKRVTADEKTWDIVDGEIIESTPLYSGLIVRSIQLDLTSIPAGDPLCLMHYLYIAHAEAWASDWSVEMGQLTSSWE